MKKMLMIILMAFVIISADAIETYSSVTITIKLARKRDCLGFGWCRSSIIIESDGSEKPVGNTAYAVADINEDGNLIVSFNKKTGLSAEGYETYFSKGVFLCEDDFPVPAEILSALKYKGKYVIKAGTYDVKENGDQLIVEF